MRILFVPLALLLLALCSFSFSLEAAKSEVNRRESAGGMESGLLRWILNSTKAKRAVGGPYDFGLKNFKKDKSECKCLRDEYCMKKKSNGKEYENVNGCGESTCYTLCEAFGCREVCDKHCTCEFGRCEMCSNSGCKQVIKCEDKRVIHAPASNCEECDSSGCKKVECMDYCRTDESAGILFEDKCFCKKDSDGKDKDCQMCDKYRCKPVSSCARFSKCTCNTADDSYRRCYGFEQGKRECRRVNSCSEAKRHEAVVQWKSARTPNPFLGRGMYFWNRCDCPSGGGLCDLCYIKQVFRKKNDWDFHPAIDVTEECTKAYEFEC